jgi:hypothetical protein
MADIPNLPASSQNNGTFSRRQTKNLFKQPMSNDAPRQQDTPPAQPSYTPPSNVYPSPSQQNGYQAQPPFMQPHPGQQPPTNNFPSTEPVVNLNNPAARWKVDSLKHVALSSRNSLQQHIAAARPYQQQQPQSVAQSYQQQARAAAQPYFQPNGAAQSYQSAPSQAMVMSPPQNMPPNNALVTVKREPTTGSVNPAAMPPRPPAGPRELPPHSAKTRLILYLFVISYILPAIFGIVNNINLYSIVAHGYSGVQHLQHVRNMANDLKAHISTIDANKLHQIQVELQGAKVDFKALHDDLMHNTYFNATGATLPKYTNSALALAQIGSDASDMGQALTDMLVIFIPALHSNALAASTKPLITPPMLAKATSTLNYILPIAKDVQAQLPLLSLDVLPIDNSQRLQVAQIVQLMPSIVSGLIQAHDMTGAIGWILGVGQPRDFLIQTVDRAEIRPTGGFTGQYSELALNGGRMGQLNLQNIGIVEENNPNPPNAGQSAPSAYRSWWPIADWGLRDSNLSADFPTSAQIAIDVYKREFQHQVDGVIVFSPFLISRVLEATGPIYISAYHETVTAQNLESKLHYYQLDNNGIRKEEVVENQSNSDIARKLFTKRVSQALMDKVRHADVTNVLAIAQEMLQALQTRDLQVYVTNPQIENLLVKYNMAATIDRSTTHDGLFVVQADVNANKGSQYVRTVMHDTVTLDANGGATHQFQMTLVYHMQDQVFGLDTYHDYVRVYVPPNAKFLNGNGFEQLGNPLCSAPAGKGPCPPYDAYGDGNLLCPIGQSDPMEETNQLTDPYNQQNHPLNNEGPPTNMTSDEPQRSMFGGWVIVPKNCTATITLSWYVPPIGHSTYDLLVQRQSGVYPDMDLTILPTPGNCTVFKATGQHFDTVLSRDQSFALRTQNTSGGEASCYEQPKL